MPTIEDACKLTKNTRAAIVLFGATEEVMRNFQRRVESLSKAILKEQNSTEESARFIDRSLPLGSESAKLYEEFLEWTTEERVFKD